MASGLVVRSPEAHVVAGVFFALCAAIGYAGYQVLFRHWFGYLKNDVSFIMYFWAWVAVMHFVVILPIISLAHATGFEKFQLPRGEAAILGTILTAIVAFIVNGLYLCIVMWGSPMLLPCASALSVPMSVFLDAALHGLKPGSVEMAGHCLVVCSVVLIMDVWPTDSNKAGSKSKKGSELAYTDDGL